MELWICFCCLKLALVDGFGSTKNPEKYQLGRVGTEERTSTVLQVQVSLNI
jgi:hypothetical protein